MFEPAFFDDVERLVSAEQATRQAFQKMWDFLAGEPPEPRADAVQTFAAFAALRMIARLRAFEGMLRVDDGHAIVNLFPDLPPIRSSWLLRRLPCRSRIGGLALGEEHFLLCRVAAAGQPYNYFLLPRRMAEAAQDNPAGLPDHAFATWITPQWFFQQYLGTPDRPQIVGVLVDEYGRERYTAAARSPWIADRDIEEKHHPAVSPGAEMRELEPGWHVLTVPHDPSAGPYAARSPLTGKRILWVDDNPSNNVFEISYLEQLGATVSHAATTAFALEAIATYGTDLVISDLARTENGRPRAHAGLELHSRLLERSNAGAAPAPLIFYTGDRSRVRSDLRSIAADRSAPLFQLVQDQLGPRAR
jgi:CheY-like chemotaxis protein